MPFFPRGYENYWQSIITFKTDYQVGIKKELEKLDRSSYIYKIGDTLMLHLFLDEHLDLNFILDLEKNGMIHSVSASTPLRYYNRFWWINKAFQDRHLHLLPVVLWSKGLKGQPCILSPRILWCCIKAQQLRANGCNTCSTKGIKTITTLPKIVKEEFSS